MKALQATRNFPRIRCHYYRSKAIATAKPQTHSTGGRWPTESLSERGVEAPQVVAEQLGL
jgi:hypothetical protein